mgnify:CR=1 FL=1
MGQKDTGSGRNIEARTTKTASGAVRRPALGIAILMVAVFFMAAQDGITRHLTQTLPPVEVIMVRHWALLAFALVLAWRRLGIMKIFRSERPMLQITRSVLLIAEMTLFAFGVKHLELADMHAMFAVYPLATMAFGVLILREQAGWRRWAAVGVGFIGMLIIVRPGLGVFDLWALSPLIAAVGFALYNVLTRMVSETDPFETSLLYNAIIGFIAGTAAGIPVWQDPTGNEWFWLGVICCTGIAAHLLLIMALEHAPATTLQPFNYMALPWSIFIGFIAFSELPDHWTLVGSAIIVMSGLFVIWRERIRSAEKTGGS